LARAIDIKDLETFKNILEFSSFQKGFGDYLTGQNSYKDQRISYLLSKGKETPLSFRSAPTLGEIYKPPLPRPSDELSTEEERKALLHYIKHYFVGKEKDDFLKEIKYTTNAARLHLLWQHFMKSVELRAKADGKEKYLYFEPIVCEKISSKAGWRRDPLKSKRKKVVLNFHKGTDLPATEGTPVFNPHPGKVIWLSHDEETGAGKTIHILHKNGLITRYKHLSKINVLLGDEVPLGRVVAESGDTGIRTTGPHLHYEIVDPDKQFHYKFSTKVRKFVGYRYKKVKKNNKYVKVKRAIYKTATIKRESVANTAPLFKKTLFVHSKTRLSVKQLKANFEALLAKYYQNLLALK
jgi:murein DD-endopeptidase MepM/ murein hydrolase activator NlpD